MSYRTTLGYKAQYMPYYGPGGSLYPGHHGIDLVPHKDVTETKFNKSFSGFPIWVNGTYIGDMGETGLAGGVHLHVDKKISDTTAYSAYRSPSDWQKITGTITFAGALGSAGNTVIVKASNGHIYRFLHLSKIHVKKGQKIVAIKSYQRVVKSPYVNYRSKATAASVKVDQFMHGEVLSFKGYVKGQSIQGNNIWYVGKITGKYIWSGSMNTKSTTGLKLIGATTTTKTVTKEPVKEAVKTPVVKEDIIDSFELKSIAEKDGGPVLHHLQAGRDAETFDITPKGDKYVMTTANTKIAKDKKFSSYLIVFVERGNERSAYYLINSIGVYIRTSDVKASAAAQTKVDEKKTLLTLFQKVLTLFKGSNGK